jgi:hypothetical protein
MPNGSRDAVKSPPPSLRCPHRHYQAEDKPTSINPDPTCRGRCIFVAGHPHPAPTTQLTAALAGATQLLTDESTVYGSVWEYAGGCCKCGICHRWVKDWGLTPPPPPPPPH